MPPQFVGFGNKQNTIPELLNYGYFNLFFKILSIIIIML